MARVIGTDRGDILNGGADELSGRLGEDRLFGGAGIDLAAATRADPPARSPGAAVDQVLKFLRDTVKSRGGDLTPAEPSPPRSSTAPMASKADGSPASLTDRLKRGVNKTIRKHFYSDAFVTRRQYFRHNGFYPDLENPKDLSEKISWLKLHDRSALHTLCADKIAVRDYVTACVGPELLVPALLVTRDPSNVRPDAIAAEAFVVKTSHDQGGVFLCRDRARFDWEGVRAQVVARFRINKYEEFREHQYKGIRPGVIVEQFVAGEAGDPFEIKIHCMHGTPAFLQVIQDRFGNRRQAFYGPDWTRLAMRGRPEPIEAELPAPPRLEPMLRTAEALAAPFLFARVDFLIGAGGLPWFGEITFHPGAGLLRYAPPEIERAFGDMIDLSRLEATREAQRRVLAAIRPAGTR